MSRLFVEKNTMYIARSQGYLKKFAGLEKGSEKGGAPQEVY